ncbi:transcriptional regulator ATRX-like [Helianthus annuus]|uniref:transcriptional regulator ATRX-like n=1 Tax=Helianthus annuus TaxID=4232 RepID=UPI000B8FBB5A|nr:transcriptional regulator ATRX-like [Helianthus annuus]
MVIADEHSNTPESYKAAKPTEPEEETIKIGEKAIESEVCGNSVPEKSETDSVEQGKKEAFNVLEKNQGDGYGVTSSQDAACEDIKETTEEHAPVVADFKEQDLNETPREFVKEETDDKSVDAQEASELSEIGSRDTEEQKYEESVKKIKQDVEIEETKPDVEIAKKEQNGLLQAITPDACTSTQTIPQVETTEHEEKEQVVNVLEKDQDEDDVTRAQEVTVEGGLQEKTHHNDNNEREVVEAKESVEEDVADVCVSTHVKESTKI